MTARKKTGLLGWLCVNALSATLDYLSWILGPTQGRELIPVSCTVIFSPSSPYIHTLKKIGKYMQ